MATTGHLASSVHESAAKPGRSGEALLERIGKTPLLRLERVGSEFPNVEFCAKAEWFNPGGSVKGRTARFAKCTKSLRRIQKSIFIRTSTATRQTGKLTTVRRRPRSGSRRAGASRILWRGWGRAEHL